MSSYKASTQRAARDILQQVLSLPTAPFAEQAVLDYIREFVRKRDALKMRSDKAGNILVHYRYGNGRIARPICLAGHLDHPGFVADRMSSNGQVKAFWRGGVRPEYFVGSGVRFFVDGRWTRGRVASIETESLNGRKSVKTAQINVRSDIPAGACGMWDFPDPRIKNGKIYARGVDDLGGVSAMLSCLDSVASRKPAGEAYFLFTRAEEVGFVGAIAACKLGTIPKRCVVVAVETSAERAEARIGHGPVLRVGDKATTFTSPATAFCAAVADDLAKKDRGFTYQRKLMDGGTCESSAYCEFGYHTTGICVPLGNYHNMNTRTQRIGAEYIALDDYDKLVRWFIALVETKRRYTGQDEALKKTLTQLERRYAPLLKRTAATLQNA